MNWLKIFKKKEIKKPETEIVVDLDKIEQLKTIIRDKNKLIAEIREGLQLAWTKIEAQETEIKSLHEQLTKVAKNNIDIDKHIRTTYENCYQYIISILKAVTAECNKYPDTQLSNGLKEMIDAAIENMDCWKNEDNKNK